MGHAKRRPAPVEVLSETMLPAERRKLVSFGGFKAAYSRRLGKAEERISELEARVKKLEADAAALSQIACSAQEIAFAFDKQRWGTIAQTDARDEHISDESIYDFIKRRKRYNQYD